MTKKRRKVTRYARSRTHGRGRKNRTRGSGNRGGFGMAGTGKRGDAKKTLVIKLYGNDYFGKDKTTRKAKVIRAPIITLQSIKDNIHNLVKKGIAKEQAGSYTLDLKYHKVIGNTQMDKKFIIHARAATKGAIDSVKQAGGELVIGKKAKEKPSLVKSQ